MHVLGISGSPSPRSRSGWLLDLALARLEGHVDSRSSVAVRSLPGSALLAADAHDPAIREAIGQVEASDLVVVATPIYKASYSGLLKLFLDLLPNDVLRGKTVLPLATGGSLAHMLALDYALKPVLSALGARDILDGVYATDAQLVAKVAVANVAVAKVAAYVPSDDLVERLDRALRPVLREGVGV